MVERSCAERTTSRKWKLHRAADGRTYLQRAPSKGVLFGDRITSFIFDCLLTPLNFPMLYVPRRVQILNGFAVYLKNSK